MAVLVVDEDIADQGQVNLGNKQAFYAFANIDVVGDGARPFYPSDPDHYTRLGWFTFGYTGDSGDGTSRTHWRAPIWLHFSTFEWTPEPQYSGSDLVLFFTDVRWSLTPGTSGHLWVYGA